MATLQLRNGTSYRVLFRHAGRRHNLPVGRVSARDAELVVAQVELVLGRIKAGLLKVPDGADVVEFVRHGGVVPPKPVAVPKVKDKLTLGRLHAEYMAAHRNSLAENTLGEVETHFKHLKMTFGDSFVVEGLELADLQRHVARREAMLNSRGKPVSPITVQKDLVSFRIAWRWAAEGKLLSGNFPRLKSVRFKRGEKKLPFMTYAEVLTRVGQGGDPAKLWECLYLKPDEVAEFLGYLKGRAESPAWLYPVACLAAYTGARRSELVRAEVGDIDFGAGVVTFRERKRKKGTATTRRVPLAAAALRRVPLAAAALEALRAWTAVRPTGVPALFTHAGPLARSRTRSRACGVRAVTLDEASDHLDRALLASPKWKVLRGWHVLRHSFISACANKGVDQRMIDAWSDHSTDEQRMRYRHLHPSTQQTAIERVFG